MGHFGWWIAIFVLVLLAVFNQKGAEIKAWRLKRRQQAHILAFLRKCIEGFDRNFKYKSKKDVGGFVYYHNLAGRITRVTIIEFIGLSFPRGEGPGSWVIEVNAPYREIDGQRRDDYTYHLCETDQFRKPRPHPWWKLTINCEIAQAAQDNMWATLRDCRGRQTVIRVPIADGVEVLMAKILDIAEVGFSQLYTVDDIWGMRLKEYLPALRASKSRVKSPKIAALVAMIEGGSKLLQDDMDFDPGNNVVANQAA